MSIKNYKVGDEVRIKKDLVIGKVYYNTLMIEEKAKYIGKKAKIVVVDDSAFNCYRLDIDSQRWRWNDEMLEPVVEQPKYVKCIDNKNMRRLLEIGKIYEIKEIRDKYNLGYKLVGNKFDDYYFYSKRFIPVSSSQPTQSTKSIIKIRQSGDTTYATYGKNSGQAIRNSSIDEYNKETGILISVARALNISEDKVKGIIDVLFNEDKEEVVDTAREFKVGDRVVGIGRVCGYSIDGVSGIIKGFDSSWNTIGVEFDKNVDGHTLDGLCIGGYGYWVNKESIKLLPRTKDEEIKLLQQENKDLQDKLDKLKDVIKSI